MLSLITGTHRSRKSAHTILGGEFHLTGDAILKMHAIHARLACGIPVVLSGECGCGKTFVIRFIAEWLRAQLLVLNVHGGTTASEIVAILDQAETLLREDDRAADDEPAGQEESPAPCETGAEAADGTRLRADDDGAGAEVVAAEGAEEGAEEAEAAEAAEEAEEPELAEAPVKRGTRRVFVFFDELNACGHVALMVEAITKHSVGGRPLHPRLRIFAAVNPYRLRAQRSDGGGGSPGLVFNLGGEVQDDMSKLVYRVHPIPRSLQQFVFDFGHLRAEQEAQYIRAILVRRLGSLRAKGHDVQKLDAMCALALLLASQAVVRDYENDPSAVSLRDAVRACELLDWFALRIMKRDEGGAKKDASAKPPPKRAGGAKISPLAAALVLGLAFVYFYRLPHAAARASYWDALLRALTGTRSGFQLGWLHGSSNLSVAWRVLAAEEHGYGKSDGTRSTKQARELSRDFDESGFAGLTQEGRCAAVLAQVQKRFVRNMEVEDGVAMNEALSENLFVTCSAPRVLTTTSSRLSPWAAAPAARPPASALRGPLIDAPPSQSAFSTCFRSSSSASRAPPRRLRCRHAQRRPRLSTHRSAPPTPLLPPTPRTRTYACGALLPLAPSPRTPGCSLPAIACPRPRCRCCPTTCRAIGAQTPSSETSRRSTSSRTSARP